MKYLASCRNRCAPENENRGSCQEGELLSSEEYLKDQHDRKMVEKKYFIGNRGKLSDRFVKGRKRNAVQAVSQGTQDKKQSQPDALTADQKKSIARKWAEKKDKKNSGSDDSLTDSRF